MEQVGLEITQLLVVVIGMLTSVIMAILKQVTDLFKKMPKSLQAGVVAVIATPLAWLSGQVGIDLPGDPSAWDGNAVNAVLTWLTAMGVHAGVGAVTK